MHWDCSITDVMMTAVLSLGLVVQQVYHPQRHALPCTEAGSCSCSPIEEIV